MKKCLFCGKQLESENKKFCDEKCRYKFNKIKILKCENCGKNFEGYVGTRYCSDECRNSNVHRCSYCGKEFVSGNLKKFCSDRCRKDYHEVGKKNFIKKCMVCNKEIVGDFRLNEGICSSSCYSEVLQWLNK